MKKKMAGTVVATSLFLVSACDTSSSAGEGEALTIRVSHTIGADTPLDQGAHKFKNLVEEASDGDISVSVYPSGQLGTESETISQLRSGDLEVVLASPALISNYHIDASVFGLPYVIEGDNENDQYENLSKLNESDVVMDLNERISDEQNLRILDWSWWYGNRHVTNSVRPIESAADLEGLQIRTPDADIHFAALQALGISPTPMSFGEVYMALQTGAIDGQENPVEVIESSGFYEAQDHLAMTGHLTQGEVFIFSEQVWETLSEDQQEMISEAALEAGRYQSDIALTENSDALSRLQDEHGMEVTYPDLDELREATSEVPEQWAEDHDSFDVDLYDAILDAQ